MSQVLVCDRCEAVVAFKTVTKFTARGPQTEWERNPQYLELDLCEACVEKMGFSFQTKTLVLDAPSRDKDAYPDEV